MSDEVYQNEKPLTICPRCHNRLETDRVCKRCHPNIYKTMTNPELSQCQKCGERFQTMHKALVYSEGTFTRAAKACPRCGWRYYVLLSN